ncbi:sensor histidine kinase [Microvirga sp. STR05]|uniref:Sensor histidine kinase n=1 Tax=Hymenobacter duratus TaxID=2771356 RepID=A0ABR8JCD5_9BACT|nr:sensor histidine kinase [Hymenobacter duratus]MBD2714454.1 sensor histidine kinase [Hymenobacter duratus]MBR7949358.1 sensor histidine kinase [Microvirga sp. STR05]
MRFQRPSKSDFAAIVVYWLFAIPVVMSAYVYESGWARAWVGMGYTLVLDTAAVLCLVFLILPNALSGKHWRGAVVALLVFLLASSVLYREGYGVIFGKPTTWTLIGLVAGILRHAVSYGLLGIFLTVKRYFEMQKRLVLIQKAQAESELRNLRAQLDPHFLFNNLNVLRGLIQQDPAAANEYLDRFASLYRFLIRHKDEDFVSLAEELQLVDEYLYLLRHRFGCAYEFRRELPVNIDMSRLLVVPGTLQLLLENAIKHNAGNEENPLIVLINISETVLTVWHARRPKLTAVESLGTGLANLRERYRLLFSRDIEVVDTAESFSVSVPLLRQAQRWSAA